MLKSSIFLVLIISLSEISICQNIPIVENAIKIQTVDRMVSFNNQVAAIGNTIQQDGSSIKYLEFYNGSSWNIIPFLIKKITAKLTQL
jgi:hypothetical protein